jgi:hypothetical protein
MSVGVDFFQSQFLLQAYDTEVVWTWDLADDQSAMFYHVVPPAYMNYSRVEVTRIVQRNADTAPRTAVEIHVKLSFDGPARDRGPLNVGLVNFYAIRVPAK